MELRQELRRRPMPMLLKRPLSRTGPSIMSREWLPRLFQTASAAWVGGGGQAGAKGEGGGSETAAGPPTAVALESFCRQPLAGPAETL